MAAMPTQLEHSSIRTLQRNTIESPVQIRSVLQSAREQGCLLWNGVNRDNESRTARIRSLGANSITLSTSNIAVDRQPQIYFEFELGHAKYFFAARPIDSAISRELTIEFPQALYEVERRDLHREPVRNAPDDVVLIDEDGRELTAEVLDRSYQGLGVRTHLDLVRELKGVLRVRASDELIAQNQFASIRHMAPDHERPGWVRVGLAVSHVREDPFFRPEKRNEILPGGIARRGWRRIALAGAVARQGRARIATALGGAPTDAYSPEVVHYKNDNGQRISALINRTSRQGGGTAVVIPPAWGKTKETLLPLAATLVDSFESSGEPLTVVRFDGTNRRGESYINPRFRSPGDEYRAFRFSQAVQDIHSTIRYLAEDDHAKPEKVVLLTFSLGAVEGRRAIATDQSGLIVGWVSVVGMVDLQSGLRAVSGGVDYAYGLSHGVRFGLHELVGVVADMDHTGLDALENNLVYLEDAKRDMENVDVPVTWLHGRYDAWMSLERVQSLMAAGETTNRRLIEIPVGHQMRSSREALEVFQLVTGEIAEMAGSSRVKPRIPDLHRMTSARQAELARRPKRPIDLHEFWRDYLLGRDRSLGIELMTATAAYAALMGTQIRRLGLDADSVVLDLGSGAGDFPVNLVRSEPSLKVRSIIEVDFVQEALARARARLALNPGISASTHYAVANLEVGDRFTIPLASSSVSAVLGSLVLSYVVDPLALLREIRRVLAPGGLVVVSSLRKDADISMIYMEGLAELPPDRVREHFGDAGEARFAELQRRFLNDAARLLDLEEEGRFTFWDTEELAALAAQAGLKVVRSDMAFGSPPQAVVVTARREP